MQNGSKVGSPWNPINVYLFESVTGDKTMHTLIHWLVTYENAIAIIVTLAVALVVVCCLECSECPSRDDDDVFRHHSL